MLTRNVLQIGRRQGRDDGRHGHASHGELKTTTTMTTITSFTTTTTILSQLLQPPPLPQDRPPPLLHLQSAAPRGTRDTGYGTWHGAAGSVYTSAPSDVPASARVFAFVFAVPFVFAASSVFLHALGTCSIIPIPICYIYSFRFHRFRRTMHHCTDVCTLRLQSHPPVPLGFWLLTLLCLY